MYTYTPTMRFLVLSPTSYSAAPEETAPASKFLNLSPTHHGPEPLFDDAEASSQSIIYTPTHAFLTLSPIHSGRPRSVRSRSDSVSSTSSVSSRSSGISITPAGARFLYLGY